MKETLILSALSPACAALLPDKLRKAWAIKN